ncbi:helix-turn-helix domain-containing protein [Clostridium culturomicium]|uniref:helix-turn-helix domain-containing protein n=1 Tax=Clostridium culturomicium TaxID=1499683 RepID=UPI00058C8C57|nr:helix-turn-helix transcriptional regulator [Clostridium culturomicium]
MLGDKVKLLRKQNKVTQQELANALNLSRSTIGMIEGNKQGASKDTLIKIADFFNVTIDYLLSDDKDMNDIDDIKISKKAEKDIKKALSETLEQLENSQDGLMFDGEPIDDETRELLRLSIENSMKLAKQIAKVKYTPNKYKDKK